LVIVPTIVDTVFSCDFGTRSATICPSSMSLLSDYEAAEIERRRREGVMGPVVLTWVNRLLEDRRERVRQLRHLQQRLRQAFRYLDALFPHEAPPPTRAPKQTGRPMCPRCGEPYLRASGISPRGVAYEHGDGKQCRTSE
jgi:hypothetical protein